MIAISFPANISRAGLDEYTRIDILEEWLIERKVESSTGDIYCRGSIRGYGTWFGARIRLNSENKLVVPEDLSQNKLPDEQVLEKVVKALENCRESLIYSR